MIGSSLKGLASALLDAIDEEWRIASTSGTGLVTATRNEEFAFIVPFRDLQDWVQDTWRPLDEAIGI